MPKDCTLPCTLDVSRFSHRNFPSFCQLSLWRMSRGHPSVCYHDISAFFRLYAPGLAFVHHSSYATRLAVPSIDPTSSGAMISPGRPSCDGL